MSTHTATMDAIEERHWQVIAHCIQQRRLALGLSQEQLATLAGLSRAEIQHIEHARRHPKSGTLRRIIAVFGISLIEFHAQVDRVEHEWQARTPRP